MPPSDIYAPPTASVAGPTPAEISAKAKGEAVLAGIGQRIGATLMDWLILVPYFVFDVYVSGLHRLAGVGTNVLYLLLALILNVGLVYRYGGSPGKLVLGLRVRLANGAPVTFKAAFMRYSVYWLATLALTVGQSLTILSMPDNSFLAENYMARITMVSARAPAWYAAVEYTMWAWAFACFISLLVTKRRRALYDFQAGTIVVRPL